MEVASFYMGKRKFIFNFNKRPEVARFLERNVPRKYIDVDDLGEDDMQDSPDSGSQ